MSERFKSEVLTAFQKVSPSRVEVEDQAVMARYRQNLRTLFFAKLRFPPQLFRGARVVDFGCGTGEVDVVMADWGATVTGFDFNPISIERARGLIDRFPCGGRLEFSVGDVDTFPLADGSFDIAASFGVIAHVPDQRHMFERMSRAVKPGGFVILGFIEDAGLIQRLLHRAIVRVNSDRSDAEIFAIAERCFAEHIDRSVRVGGRSAAGVINDYLVNPHYIGLSSNDLADWAEESGLEFYATWPNTDLAFVADSPYFPPLKRSTPAYRLFVTLNRLRWVFAQAEDGVVYDELARDQVALADAIEGYLGKLTRMLQQETYSTAKLDELRDDRVRMTGAVREAGAALAARLATDLEQLVEEVERLLSLIVGKAQDGGEFDLARVKGLLFHGYNGLGTSYTVFHRPE